MEKIQKRCFLRVPFKSETILKAQDALIDGTIKNLSIGGAFIDTPEKIEPDTRVEIEIILDDPPPSVTVILSAKVARLAPEGIAIKFTEMSMDTYERLRDIISDINGDKRKVVEEFLKYMHLEAYLEF
jgi:hypothetical protein